jgi:hypothetical protein
MSDLGIGFKDLNTAAKLARGYFREPRHREKSRMSSAPAFNARGVWAI